MKEFGKALIIILLLAIISQSFIVTIYTYQKVQDYREAAGAGYSGRASAGHINFCINAQPIIDMSNCTNTTMQNDYYDCRMQVIDPDYNLITYGAEMLSNKTTYPPLKAIPRVLPFKPDAFGRINFSTDNDDVGKYNFSLSASDSMGCSNSNTQALFSLEILNVNDPPYLVHNLSSQQYQPEVRLLAFYLSNYFKDPELDPLHYTVTDVVPNPGIEIEIENGTSAVWILGNVCNLSRQVIFNAFDPYNATNNSNVFTIQCLGEELTTPSTGGGSGGGGGGGGSSKLCRPEYDCFDYHRCNSSNLKVQRCIDTKGCGDERLITLPCNYELENLCKENWNCTEWGPCLSNNTQFRDCIDESDCGTNVNMPIISQACEYIGTCNDSIKNCHDNSCEEGIDCGGPCSPCKSIQVPYPFAEEKGVAVYVVTGIILLLLTAILIYQYFKKEINAALAKAGWLISRRKKKHILITKEEKKRILAEIAELEKSLAKASGKDVFHVVNKLYGSLAYYFQRACKSKESPEFDLAQLPGLLESKKRKIIPILRKIFLGLSARYIKTSRDERLVTKASVRLLLEELKNITLQTSEVEQADLAREEKEAKPGQGDDDVAKLMTAIFNDYIPLEFLELDIAKKKYLELSAIYEKLPIKEQEMLYDDVTLLYHNISYVNTWLGPMQKM